MTECRLHLVIPCKAYSYRRTPYTGFSAHLAPTEPWSYLHPPASETFKFQGDANLKVRPRLTEPLRLKYVCVSDSVCSDRPTRRMKRGSRKCGLFERPPTDRSSPFESSNSDSEAKLPAPLSICEENETTTLGGCTASWLAINVPWVASAALSTTP